MCKIKDT